MNRNVKNEVLRREAEDRLCGWLLLAMFTFVGATGFCYGTYVANVQTAGLELEASLIIIASTALVIGGWFLKNAAIALNLIRDLNDKAAMRKQLLSNIPRSSKRSLPIEFKNRLQ